MRINNIKMYYPNSFKGREITNKGIFETCKELIDSQKQLYCNEIGNFSFPTGGKRFVKYYPDKKVQLLEYFNGSHESFYPNGNPHYVINPDGSEMRWYENGQLEHVKLADRAEKRWSTDGKTEFTAYSGGLKKWF